MDNQTECGLAEYILDILNITGLLSKYQMEQLKYLVQIQESRQNIAEVRRIDRETLGLNFNNKYKLAYRTPSITDQCHNESEGDKLLKATTILKDILPKYFSRHLKDQDTMPSCNGCYVDSSTGVDTTTDLNDYHINRSSHTDKEGHSSHLRYSDSSTQMENRSDDTFVFEEMTNLMKKSASLMPEESICHIEDFLRICLDELYDKNAQLQYTSSTRIFISNHHSKHTSLDHELNDIDSSMISMIESTLDTCKISREMDEYYRSAAMNDGNDNIERTEYQEYGTSPVIQEDDYEAETDEDAWQRGQGHLFPKGQDEKPMYQSKENDVDSCVDASKTEQSPVENHSSENQINEKKSVAMPSTLSYYSPPESKPYNLAAEASPGAQHYHGDDEFFCDIPVVPELNPGFTKVNKARDLSNHDTERTTWSRVFVTMEDFMTWLKGNGINVPTDASPGNVHPPISLSHPREFDGSPISVSSFKPRNKASNLEEMLDLKGKQQTVIKSDIKEDFQKKVSLYVQPEFTLSNEINKAKNAIENEQVSCKNLVGEGSPLDPQINKNIMKAMKAAHWIVAEENHFGMIDNSNSSSPRGNFEFSNEGGTFDESRSSSDIIIPAMIKSERESKDVNRTVGEKQDEFKKDKYDTDVYYPKEYYRTTPDLTHGNDREEESDDKSFKSEIIPNIISNLVKDLKPDIYDQDGYSSTDEDDSWMVPSIPPKSPFSFLNMENKIDNETHNEVSFDKEPDSSEKPIKQTEECNSFRSDDETYCKDIIHDNEKAIKAQSKMATEVFKEVVVKGLPPLPPDVQIMRDERRILRHMIKYGNQENMDFENMTPSTTKNDVTQQNNNDSSDFGNYEEDKRSLNDNKYTDSGNIGKENNDQDNGKKYDEINRESLDPWDAVEPCNRPEITADDSDYKNNVEVTEIEQFDEEKNDGVCLENNSVGDKGTQDEHNEENHYGNNDEGNHEERGETHSVKTKSIYSWDSEEGDKQNVSRKDIDDCFGKSTHTLDSNEKREEDKQKEAKTPQLTSILSNEKKDINPEKHVDMDSLDQKNDQAVVQVLKQESTISIPVKAEKENELITDKEVPIPVKAKKKKGVSTDKTVAEVLKQERSQPKAVKVKKEHELKTDKAEISPNVFSKNADIHNKEKEKNETNINSINKAARTHKLKFADSHVEHEPEEFSYKKTLESEGSWQEKQSDVKPQTILGIKSTLNDRPRNKEKQSRNQSKKEGGLDVSNGTNDASKYKMKADIISEKRIKRENLSKQEVPSVRLNVPKAFKPAHKHERKVDVISEKRNYLYHGAPVVGKGDDGHTLKKSSYGVLPDIEKCTEFGKDRETKTTKGQRYGNSLDFTSEPTPQSTQQTFENSVPRNLLLCQNPLSPNLKGLAISGCKKLISQTRPCGTSSFHAVGNISSSCFGTETLERHGVLAPITPIQTQSVPEVKNTKRHPEFKNPKRHTSLAPLEVKDRNEGKKNKKKESKNGKQEEKEQGDESIEFKNLKRHTSLPPIEVKMGNDCKKNKKKKLKNGKQEKQEQGDKSKQKKKSEKPDKKQTPEQNSFKHCHTNLRVNAPLSNDCYKLKCNVSDDMDEFPGFRATRRNIEMNDDFVLNSSYGSSKFSPAKRNKYEF